MDLAQLKADLIVSERVAVAKGGFDVVGLSLPAIVSIARRNWDAAKALFENLLLQTGENPQLAPEQVAAFTGGLLEQFPMVAADVIAHAAGHPSVEAAEIYGMLPVAIQIDALERIARLTFTAEQPPKKVLAVVVRALTGIGISPNPSA